MSVIIKVYSNHTLSFDNYSDGIGLIEKLLKINVQDSENVQSEHFNDENKINYFTNHNYFEKRYKKDRTIWVYSNFNLCKRFVVHKHFVEFDISGKLNIKTHIWQKLVSKQYEYFVSWDKNGFDKTLTEWNNTRNYLSDITKKLGGNTILYLNDGSELTPAEELIWDGKNIDSVISFLKSISKLNEYYELVKRLKEFPQDNGFKETLK